MRTKDEVLQYIKENDVKFIKLAFCDLFGTQKNASVYAEHFAEICENGLPFNPKVIHGFDRASACQDVRLFPDLSTMSVLPWRPQQGRVVRFYCNIRRQNGDAFICDTRAFLESALKRCEQMGLTATFGAECEFYLFKTDENGEATKVPHDNGTYFDINPLDRGEDVRREIYFAMEDMGIPPLSSHHEKGPGQHQIDFAHSDALSTADNLLSFKTVVRAIAAKYNLFASFMPKPLANKNGSGLHINVALSRKGENLFRNFDETAQSFVAGVMAHTAEMTVFFNPLTNSYERFGAFEAPKALTWSYLNRGQLLRIVPEAGMELRSTDPTVNPYLAFGLLLHAGLDGIEQNLKLEPERTEDNNAALLPQTLTEAVSVAQKSAFLQTHLDADVLTPYLESKEQEADDFARAKDKSAFYTEHYFNIT